MRRVYFLAGLLWAVSISAQNYNIDGSVNAPLFRFSHSMDTLSLESALNPKESLLKSYRGDSFKKGEQEMEESYRYKWLFKSSYDYVKSPLIAIDNLRLQKEFDIVKSAHTLRFDLGKLLSESTYLGISVPIQQMILSSGDSKNILGDVDFILKWRLSSNRCEWCFALAPTVSLSLGQAKYFNSDNSTGVGLKMILDHYFKDLYVYANLGYRYASHSYLALRDGTRVLDSINNKNLFGGGVGFNYSFSKSFSLLAEIIGSVALPYDRDQNPVEWNVALKANPVENLALFAGLGLEGVVRNSARSNQMQYFAGLKYMFGKDKRIRPVYPNEVAPEILPSLQKLKQNLSLYREINFETNGDKILSESYDKLDSAAELMNKYIDQIKLLTIEGHTDSRASRVYNLDLSKRRADSVVKYLTAKGIPSSKLRGIGLGEELPKVKEVDEHTRRLNRRVEFELSGILYEVKE